MKSNSAPCWIALAFSFALSVSLTCRAEDKSFLSGSSKGQPIYEEKAEHDRDGIGKFYRGREIAQVRGHQARDSLKRNNREAQESPNLLLAAWHIKPGDAVADIGAGPGFYSRRM